MNQTFEPVLAQTLANSQTSAIAERETEVLFWEEYSLFSNAGFAIILFALVWYGKNQTKKMARAIRSEKHKNRGLRKHLKAILNDKHKLETNPDLIHSRDWNLDYLRVRMQEDEFRKTIMAQVKIEIENVLKKYIYNNSYKIGKNKPKIDAAFEINCQTDISGQITKRVLFRVKIVGLGLPLQGTSKTIQEILKCIENSLDLKSNETWQPQIQGNSVFISWDSQAKPTPLLILEDCSNII